MTRTYRVSGMTCEGCARAVTRAIQRLAPAAQVRVDLAGGQVSVAEGPEEGLVAEAVKKAGFAFEGAA
jgi:copper chaperone